jgi:RNA polymerase sigma-70 factor (ECF subfamily)
MALSVHDPDCEVVVYACEGSADAFALLVDRYYAQTRRRLVYLSRDLELASDLTQEAFLIAFQKLNQLSNGQSFSVWLSRIAQNLFYAEWHRRQHRNQISLELFLELHPGRPPIAQFDEAAAFDDQELLAGAMAQLSPALRKALVLHDVDGFTIQEIAQILHISPPAAGRSKSLSENR